MLTPAQAPAGSSPARAAIGRRVTALPVQPKLRVGPVDDPLEQEADAIADRVVRMPGRDRSAPRPCPGCRPTEPLAGSSADGASDLSIGGARDPSELAAERLADRAVPAHAEVSEAAPPVAPGTAPAPAPQGVADAMARLGAGRPLSPGARAFFEPRFDYDFSRVRLHEGPAANNASRAVGADALAIGNHIAFAEGRASPRAVAHELAHVARGDRGIRRRIAVKDDPAIGLFSTLKETYGLEAAVTSAKSVYYVASRKDDGELPAQIVQNMIHSDRVFALEGETQSAVETNLSRHVSARVGIVDYAHDIRLGFTTGEPRLDKKKWEFFDKELKARVDGISSMIREEPIPEAEKERKILEVSEEAIKSVFQDNIRRDEINAILDDVRQKSLEHKARKGDTRDFPYATACWMATNLVVFGGARGELQAHRLDKKNADRKDETLQAWTDWIPGDWGYIANTGTATPAPGQEGENIVCLGNRLFWAHWNPSRPIQSLEELFDMVKGWNGSAELVTERSYPAVGLKPSS
jgi:hypothetical protein